MGLDCSGSLVLLSGGLDSAACAHHLRQSPGDISAVFIDFGQASARRERAAATEVASLLGMDLSVVEVKSGTAFGPGEIIGRNAFLAFTALLTGNLRSGVIALGIHSGTPYYDCSELFVKRLVS